ncbi:MAG: ferrous iron transport protein B [Clostridia bacterium]|nr:ferrous iron transport protein B [Clostridia bacterium]
MGLTNSSIGLNALDSELVIKKKSESDKIVALAGNPNVGKSTVFNSLTGMHQHTGNWPGKTVANAQGYYETKKESYVLVDIPGTYSLSPNSPEEEVARNFICFSKPDAVVVVCDATSLERNLNLVLQTLEISEKVVVCVNLIDEAKRKGIHIDAKLLSERLGVRVVKTVAQKKKSLKELTDAIDETVNSGGEKFVLHCEKELDEAIEEIEKKIKPYLKGKIDARWLALRLLTEDISIKEETDKLLGKEFLGNEEINNFVRKKIKELKEKGFDKEKINDTVSNARIKKAEEICQGVIRYEKKHYNSFDRKMDRILTSKWTGYPLMLLMLAFIFYLTIVGANYPSEWLFGALFSFEDVLLKVFNYFNAPPWITSLFVSGMYRVTAWVVSVMLPPMAIFFPLFTLLEDSGILPRIAYNLDRPFKCCKSCGKQALTMCMGFGCNAAGVIGARIIDSPRERMLAILTNNFVPCNGRFPTIISLITMFFVAKGGGILSALLLTFVVLMGIGMTFLSTKLLSSTVLKGYPSSFALELPSYRKPQIGSVIVRSIFDRTLFVLGRAISVAAPAGIIIWIMANAHIGGETLLNIVSAFLEPFASLIGLDGVILMAFILGFPANEIVVPIIMMAYMQTGTLSDSQSIWEMKNIFIQNGWTICTAVCTILFSLMHWPCSTTLLTIKKETGSLGWTALGFLVPTVFGVVCCALVNLVYHIII